MIYNFDEETNRKNTNCAKYDGLKKYFGYEDLNPLWVADMDFKTPSFINDAIVKAASNSLYGYSVDTPELYASIINWQKNEHDWEIEQKDIFMINGVVPAYSACIEAFSEVGDEVIVQTPIYPPLFKCVKANERKLVINELKKDENGYYTMDLEDLEKKITSKTKILALCSPHNPVGRVWSKEELEKLANICIKHNITIVSDEIHSDITFKKFTPLASISKEIANQTITLNSAGKTFNIAGLNCAYAVSKNAEILEKFKKVAIKREINSINFFGYVSTRAAYENGSAFVKELKAYLMNNIIFTKDFFEKNSLNIDFFIPEATYLLWLDFSKTGLSHLEIKNILLTKSKIALNDGVSFGSNGNKFFRLNTALSKKALNIALNQFVKNFSK
ncbi:MalY/PatB family protein [Aliarcobacter butzleri]|uniref:cysteine-S-conjugate beta-lyase n=1 Tax=Aliarcobacter butzleri L351 TaxID=1447259 RepID=A0A837J2I8_9BACT|nr:PatB family C-S lyase [Aliarcobacter butzleri]KLD99602.1 aminotransferase [Aliarcobacter butzleri L351]KLE12523.1 aminotransferase [Aliarcobacter butzleri L350]MDN5046323.1 PatB family C-S lyase [Aliarcobacter butzleri]MDN5058164.1 PatB family C-S lyase [Aliarcobacter butzleri]MDN5108643.1 PatB family C-S lyase [Aliarcobacter butzleri]